MPKVIFWSVVAFRVMVVFIVICGLTLLAGDGIQYFSGQWLVRHFGQSAIVWLIVFQGITVFASAMVALVISILAFYDQVMDPDSELRDDCAYFAHRLFDTGGHDIGP
jgi:hypothetical protein